VLLGVKRALLAGAIALAIPVMILAWRGAGMLVGPSDGGGKAGYNEADVAFAEMMIPHHEQAVEMVALVPHRAADPRIKQLATQIQVGQPPEITLLTGFLTSWGKPVPSPHGHDMPGMMSDQAMERLKAATGGDFDRMFAQMMIDHHNGAIQMARDEQAKGANAEARALAETIEQDQTTEIGMFQDFLARP
jgi:uncharacterized protein (DUF305 family)